MLFRFYNAITDLLTPSSANLMESSDIIYADLLKRSKLAVFTQLLSLVVLISCFETNFFEELKIVYAMLTLLVLLGLRLAMAFQLGPRSSEVGRFFFTVMTLSLANVWGFIFHQMFGVSHTASSYSMTVLLATGLISSAVYSYGSSRRDFLIYVTIVFAYAIEYFYRQWIHENAAGSLLLCISFYIFVVAQGISQNKSWRDLLRSQRQLQAIFDTFPGVISLLRSDRFESVSNGIREYSVRGAGELSGRKIDHFSNPLLIEKYYSFKNSKDQSRQQEVKLSTDFGEKINLLIMKKVEMSDDIILILLDMTKYKMAEAELNRNRMQLASAAKMVALGQMAGGLAHEINNPLAVISAKASQVESLLSRETLTGGEKIKNSLEMIQNTVQRVAKIVRGLKNFARDGSGEEMQEAVVDQVVQDTFAYCEFRFKNNNVEFEYLNPHLDVRINCNTTQMSQVLLNLLNNSFDAIANQNEKKIQLIVSIEKHRLIMKVIDSGPGVSVEYREDLMNPFFTTKEIGQGTGLGLSISKGIIEAHGGRLYFDFSQRNTTVVIEIPLALPQQQPKSA